MRKFTDSEVRWGIVGVGDVCEVKSAPAMNLVPNSRLVAVMRRNEEKVKDYAARHGVEKWYTDAHALIHDPEVNAIYIATPPNVHLELTRMSAEAGKPVYVEKPMARNHAECREMIDICEKADVPLFVAYYRRALPHFLKIKELMDSGAIGNIRSIHINMRQVVEPEIIRRLEHNWRVIPEIAGGGYFFDLASHQLDLMDFFFGKITHASGFSGNQAKSYDVEDIVVGSFVFESGVFGTGNWCFTSSKSAEIDETVIEGSEGQIWFATFGRGEFRLIQDGKKPEVLQFEIPKHIQQPLIESIVNELLGSGTSASTGMSGARANWVMGELTKNRVF
jgi:predicted dehydrogenase